MEIQTSKKPRKRLYRSRTDRMLGGVCGGLADYFNIDPTWIRLIFVVFLIAALSTLILYIVLWVIVPEEPTPIINPSNTHHPPG